MVALHFCHCPSLYFVVTTFTAKIPIHALSTIDIKGNCCKQLWLEPTLNQHTSFWAQLLSIHHVVCVWWYALWSDRPRQTEDTSLWEDLMMLSSFTITTCWILVTIPQKWRKLHFYPEKWESARSKFRISRARVNSQNCVKCSYQYLSEMLIQSIFYCSRI